jgi:pimeloyl-ACP methyl ester carboxylesterase
LRFHWLEWGAPDRAPLLLLHGGRSSARGTWSQTAPSLARGYHVYAPDHRGHGESSWDPEARYTVTSFVADLERLLDHLSLDRVSLVGHSMGAFIGLVYASQHPDRVRSLVLVDWAPPSEHRAPDAGRAVQPTPIFFDSRPAAEAYVRARFPEAARDRPLDYGLVDLPDGRVTWRADVAGLARAWSRARADRRLLDGGWPEVAALRTPTLLLRGGRSSVAAADACARMAAANPLVRVHDYPDAGHWLHQDAHEEFVADVVAFLAENDRPS